MFERDILETDCKLSYNLAKIILTLLVAALLAQLAMDKARILHGHVWYLHDQRDQKVGTDWSW